MVRNFKVLFFNPFYPKKGQHRHRNRCKSDTEIGVSIGSTDLLPDFRNSKYFGPLTNIHDRISTTNDPNLSQNFTNIGKKAVFFHEHQ